MNGSARDVETIDGFASRFDVYESCGEDDTMAKQERHLVSNYGTLWARNKGNIRRLKSKLYGVYVLCDGSTPVYIGRGKLSTRIRHHQHSERRGQFWDHFSWFAIPERDLEADVEALLLRMLPYFLRSLNKKRTEFRFAKREKEESSVADSIRRPHFLTEHSKR